MASIFRYLIFNIKPIQYKNIYFDVYCHALLIINPEIMIKDQKSKIQTIEINISRQVLMLLTLTILLSFSCTSEPTAILKLIVSEKAGMDRSLEYIEIEVPLKDKSRENGDICLKEVNNTELIAGQILDTISRPSGQRFLRCIFPVSMGANSTKSFEIVHGTAELRNEILKYQGQDINIKIENSDFIADLTDVKATAENGLGSGQLAGLILKHFNNQLLQRTHINMHWAPNFQKEGLDYKTFGHIQNPDRLDVIKGPYTFSLYRSGSVDGYEEIRVNCMYQFYAGLPYFTFSSEILIKEDTELMLLRNDEMTMDSLFTHVTYLHSDGKGNTVGLYEGDAIDQLAEDPIHDDATWLYFYNQYKKYAFGSIRMEYDNTNLNGEPSPLYGEHTKITRSAGNGRYWNRRLINDHNTLLPAGSRYRAKNAYLIFKLEDRDPSITIKEYYKKLSQPLEVKYEVD